MLLCCPCNGKAAVGDDAVDCLAHGAAVPTKGLGVFAVLDALGGFSVLEGKVWEEGVLSEVASDPSPDG